MGKEQEALSELLKLKAYLVQKLSTHRFDVDIHEMLDMINKSIEKVK